MEGTDNVLGMDFDDLAKQTGNNRAANFVVMGALAQLVGLPLSVLKEFNSQRYTRGRPSDQQIIDSNNMALDLGSKESLNSGFSLGELENSIKPEETTNQPPTKPNLIHSTIKGFRGGLLSDFA